METDKGKKNENPNDIKIVVDDFDASKVKVDNNKNASKVDKK